MDQAKDPRTLRVTDPRALRALAHPLRLQLLSLLRTLGPMTASQAAERTGESAGSCSFHLRQLAKWGYIEETGEGKGRERPWRATAELSVIPVGAEEPGFGDAADAFTNVLAEQYLAQLRAWISKRRSEPAAWQEAASIGDIALYLTPEEVHRASTAIQAIIEEVATAVRDRPVPSPEARMIQFVYLAFPRTDLEV